MRPVRSAILSFVLVATAAACGSSATTPPQPTTAAALVQPTVAPTASPAAASASAPASASPTLAVTPAPTSPSHTQTISLYEWKVIAATTLKAGKNTFTISNFGTVPHELLVFKSKLDLAAYPKDKAGDIVEDGAGIKLLSDGENIDPAGAQVRTVDLAAGTYVFVCNIPGHFKAGMYTVVTVIN